MAILPDNKLHLSNVEFRGEVIYFLVLDRFYSGKDQDFHHRTDLDDPTQKEWNKYWGGDLQGLLEKLDYLQDLGVTSIWTTPLFEQVEALECEGVRAPLHGYWTRDFKRINSRWVNELSEVRLFSMQNTIFDKLIEELHRRGMRFVLDIVCNHSSPATDQGKGLLYDDGVLVADFDNDTQHWYHHYGEVKDWCDEWQVQNGELCGLATFNENNILYRRYIKDAIKMWLDKGVDALRIDTVKHMPLWFWQEFNADMQSHKADVFIFGEWIHNHPGHENSVRFANHAGMSLLDFGLCHALRECLGHRSEAGFHEVHAIFEQDARYRSATELVTFFENHDMPRMQSVNAEPWAVHAALVLILTGRGIPCLYYGCEQYLHDDTDGGQDPYNRPMMDSWDNTEATRITKLLSQERQHNQAMQVGGHWSVLVESDVYAFSRRYRDARSLTLINRGGPRELSLQNLDLPDGKHVCLLSGFSIEVNQGRSLISVQHQELLVFSNRGSLEQGETMLRVQVNGAPTNPGDRLCIIGDSEQFGQWDLREAFELECINSNTWFGDIVCTSLCGKSLAYKYVIFPADSSAAPLRECRTVRRRLVQEHGVAKWRDIWEE